MKIGIAGVSGRMGQSVVRVVEETDGVSIVAGSVRASTRKDDGAFPLVISARELFASADAVIDFTAPELTVKLAEEAARTGKALISGTTGLTEDQHQKLAACAHKAPILWAANLSVGVALVTALVEEAARCLDDDYDIEIMEMHHRHKKDAPSGTALAFGKAAAEARGNTFDAVATLSREGITGARERGTIGFAALRGGEVIGDHTVMFAGEHERIEIAHKSSSREIYAYGAVRAAKYLHGKPPGLYSMANVIG